MTTVILIAVFRMTVLMTFTLPMTSSHGIRYMDQERPSSAGDEVCEITGATMTCIGIPQTVPPSVTSVEVLFHHGTLRGAFVDPSWSHVTRLQINGTTEIIVDNDLLGLEHVQELSLSFPHFLNFTNQAFAATPHVTTLELLNMDFIHPDTLLEAVTHTGVLTQLRNLIFNPGNAQKPPSFILDDSIIQGLLQRPLSSLNFSNSIIVGSRKALFSIVLKLDVLNVSGSFLIYSDVILCSVTTNAQRPFLHLLDVSGITTSYRTQPSNLNNIQTSHFVVFLFQIELVYANSMLSKDNTFATSYNFTGQRTFLRRLYARRNSFTRFEAAVTLNVDNVFELFDLSENKIEYISPDFVTNAINLKYLYLSKNRLSVMERSLEFSQIFAGFSNLSILCLDYNNLSFIPWNMFENNRNLLEVNLANNRLSTIEFKILNLIRLQILDVKWNMIHTIEGLALARIKSFVHERLQDETGHIFQLLLQENPLTCTCKSIDFIRWLYNYAAANKGSTQQLNICSYERAHIAVSREAVAKCEYLCKRPMVIVMTISGSAIILIVAGITVSVCLRRRKQYKYEKTKTNFLQAFQTGLVRQKYISFFAYASIDEAIVNDVLRNRLDDKLKELIQLNRDTIATGDDFRPGYRITEETYRLISESCVFIAVVSNAFLVSEYCKGEISEACAQNKPVVIVLLGEVEEQRMAGYLREVFKRYSRAVIRRNQHGQFQITPSVDAIATSVLSLAMDNYQNRM